MRPEPGERSAPGKRDDAGITLHLQLQARGRCSTGAPRELTVSGDVSAPGLRPHTLIEHGVAVLDPDAGLTLRLGWRDKQGPRSLLAAPKAGGRGLAVTLRDDRDGGVIGTGTVPDAWWQLTRSLASVHATDAASVAQAARHGTDLAVALLRAAAR
jgi:hypothetical protein